MLGSKTPKDYINMKTSIKALIGAGIFLVVVGGWWISTHNQIIALDQNVKLTYSQVQNVMQRQADLIPNLVATVKGTAAFERGAFTDIANARSGLAVGKISAEDVAKNPDLQKKLVDAQAQMGRALVQLNATREAYPELKSNKQFSDLMVELTGSQNRITVERRRNQLAVQTFNTRVLMFPASLAAGGYAPYPYFQGSDAAQTAPQVQF
jgi:LemA protein